MIDDINKEIENLKNDEESYIKYIECFCEIDKVIEENSEEYIEFKKMDENSFDDEY